MLALLGMSIFGSLSPSPDTLHSACAPIAPYVARAHDAMVTASGLAAQSGASAISVGQTLHPSGRDFKTVEQNAPQIDSLTQSGLEAAVDGAAAADGISDKKLKARALALLETYQQRLNALRTYAAVALAYERTANSRNIDLSRARLAANRSQTTTINSNSYGTSSNSVNGSINGNAFTAFGSGTSTGATTTTINQPAQTPNVGAIELFLSGSHDQATLDQIGPILTELLPNVHDVPLNMRYSEDLWQQACPAQRPFASAAP